MTNSKNDRGHSDGARANKDKQQQSGNKEQTKNKTMQKDSKRPAPPDEDEETVNHADSDMDPERKTQIDDNPDETRKKIPHMRK
ncbi:MAG: hypothetical protein Q8927_06195 [Bacteroidota bacterium]|nr:hypothetical protein [Bacteroidota bacterium]MDP4215774.1 hypothetical protein [Bacteroidota bacterium]MDP4245705.1 hypothetical protein [Bacteroidota bacterium]MDP4256208.1 hypothetical protein [Bacteroidota bacterium]MDP4259189.1 hypothetical protein [Bacteroidota bacterium]